MTAFCAKPGQLQLQFVGKDVCQALGYANHNKAMSDHCRGVTKRYPIVDSLGRTQYARVLTEPDVLRLIVARTLPDAVRFEAWVFEEVLPTIRKTGAYAMPGAAPDYSALVKTVVTEAIQAMIPMMRDLVQTEFAAKHVTVRHGMTAGQVMDRYGFPSRRGFAGWLSRQLRLLGCQIDGGGCAEMGGRTAYLFDPDKVRAQMTVGKFRSACLERIAAQGGQLALFPGRQIAAVKE